MASQWSYRVLAAFGYPRHVVGSRLSAPRRHLPPPCVAAALVVLTSATIARPQQPPDAGQQRQACFDSHVAAQRLQRDGHLQQARAKLIECGQPSCPKVLIGECSEWLRALEQRMPSVVVDAVAPDGRQAVDVRVSLDGQVVATSLDGKAIDVDPGRHTLRYELAGARPVEEQVLVREGEKDRRLVVRFVAPDGPPATADRETAASRPIPTATYVFGAAGIVGLGVFATFGAIGMSQRGDLDAKGCKPNCSAEDVDRVRRSFLVADVSLAVGVACLGTAAVLFLTRPSAAPPHKASHRGARVGAAMLPLGGMGTVAGGF